MAAEKAKDTKAKDTKAKDTKAKDPKAKKDTDLEDDDAAAEETADQAPSPSGKRLPGKKLVLMIGLPVALLIGGGVGAWQFGLLDKLTGGHETTTKSADPRNLVFYDLPEMLVNLNSTGRQTNYLKLKVALELEDQSAIKQVESAMPRIVDSFQVYLRELRPDELTGSAGMYRLKEELMFRLNTAVYPTKVSDVLFKEMLVQ
jgi:flagellar FliL protein